MDVTWRKLIKINTMGGDEVRDLPRLLYWAISETDSPAYDLRKYNPPNSYYLFKYTISGHAMLSYRGELQKLSPGTALLEKFPSKDYYLYYPADGVEPWRGVYIEFEAGPLEQTLVNLEKRYGLVFNLAPDEDIVRRLLNFGEGLNDGGTVNIRALDGAGLIFQLLAFLREYESPTVSFHNNLLERICAYIGANLRQPLLVKDIAARFSISRGHLDRMFRERLRVPPLRYINAERLRLACQLIMDTRLNNAEIADRVGIQSMVHFHRLFKQNVGMTPGEFRKSESQLEIAKGLR